jgi:hypothetical protein
VAPKTLIWDCELKPNVVSAWSLFKPMIGINQVIEPAGIICFAWRWHGQKKTHFLSEWDDGYSVMVGKLHDLFDEADVVAGFNSNSFDNKHANAAFVLEGLAPPSPYKQVDLYREAKKHFNFPSRKLDYIATQLGLGSKVQHSGMSLWNEVLRPSTDESGRKARALMRRYCIGDVDLTADLYDRLLPWVTPGVSAGLFVDESEPVCTNCGSADLNRRGYAYTTVARYRRFQCRNCLRWLRSKSSDKVSELRPV